MSEPIRPDLCILGASSAGLTLAFAAAAMGAPVALIDPEPRGARDREGAAVAAALRAAAGAATEIRRGAMLGVAAQSPAVDFTRIQRRAHDLLDRLSVSESEARLGALGIRVIRARPQFTNMYRVMAGDVEIEARRYVIALPPKPPDVPEDWPARVLTPASLRELTALPEHLVVMGKDPLGLELAQSFARLGSQVTLLAPGSILADEDPEMAEVVVRQLRADGVDLRSSVGVARLEADGPGLRIARDGFEVSASHVLALGDGLADLDGLGLTAAGIASEAGTLRVDADLRTSNRRVYAIGAAVAPFPSAQAAEHQASLVLRSALLRLPVRLRPIAVPRLLRTDPELAVAGLREAEARELGHKIHVHRWSFAENEVAQARGRTRGHIKVVSAGGRVLGASIVGPEAGELIGLWQLAVDRRMKLSALAGLVLPAPTFGEVSRRAALSSFGARLRHPLLGPALRLLRRLG